MTETVNIVLIKQSPTKIINLIIYACLVDWHFMLNTFKLYKQHRINGNHDYVLHAVVSSKRM